MIEVTIARDPSYAPCSYLLCKVTRDNKNRPSWNTRDESSTVLIQSDWDYPSIARLFGWSGICCGFTDGTIGCKEHGKTATDFISSAREWLDAHLDEVFADGSDYFN